MRAVNKLILGLLAGVVTLTAVSAVVLVVAGFYGPRDGPSDSTDPVTSPGYVLLAMETAYGQIILEIDTLRAPITAANFLRYVDDGYYTGGTFFRAVTPDNQPSDSIRIEVLQGGSNRERRDEMRDPISLEKTSDTGLRHLDGTISMARGGPDTATSSFFICIGNQPSLDYGGKRNPDGQGFAAFGRVISGMSVVLKIQSLPTEGQTLIDPVIIKSIDRQESE